MDAAEGQPRIPPGPPGQLGQPRAAAPATAAAGPDTEPTSDTQSVPDDALFSHHATDLGLAGTRRRPPDDTDLAAGESLGDVRIVRLIAEGGMGRVYEGLQAQPRRPVAVKVMRSTRLAPAAIERFHREIEVLARLVHPGIAQVYLAGTCRVDGHEIPYYVMELVAGGKTILDHCESAGLDCVERLRLLVAVCDAIAHGHARGVVHRDIKPGNVLVDPEGRPKVIDFGIARVPGEPTAGSALAPDGPAAPGDPCDADASRTQAGTLLGTRRCMSPEQFAADGQAINAASDVWSLGVLLHELLAGSPPHDLDGLPLPVAARRVAEQQPRPLVVRDRSLDRRSQRRLRSIADRCLAKDSLDRYPTARELRDALQSLLADAAGPRPIGRGKILPELFPAAGALGAVAILATVAAIIGFPRIRQPGPIPVAGGRPSASPASPAASPRSGADEAVVRPLTARMANVSSGRVDPLDWLSISFDRDVAALDPAHFRLTRDGVEVPLRGATTAGSGRAWRLEGLAPLTQEAGLYRMAIAVGERAPRAVDGGRVGESMPVEWRMPDRLRVAFDCSAPEWRSHVVSIKGLERYTERYAGRETFIRPTEPGREGEVVMRFPCPFPIQDATLWARLAVWTTGDPFPYDPGARAALDVSRDGSEWVPVETREAGRGGFAGGPFDISATVAGGKEVWIRARLTGTREWPGDGLIYAQFLRSDSAADRPAFSLELVGSHPPLIPASATADGLPRTGSGRSGSAE